jgi:hypothetical protein
VAEVCRRLDGMPLAIELAAARVSVLSPTALLDGLDDRIRMLSGGRRRQRGRTLKATIDWSYDLLADDEQQFFRRLGVFLGSFDIPAAAAVGSVSAAEATDLIESIFARSLISGSTEWPDRGERWTKLADFLLHTCLANSQNLAEVLARLGRCRTHVEDPDVDSELAQCQIYIAMISSDWDKYIQTSLDEMQRDAPTTPDSGIWSCQWLSRLSTPNKRWSMSNDLLNSRPGSTPTRSDSGSCLTATPSAAWRQTQRPRDAMPSRYSRSAVAADSTISTSSQRCR